MGYTWDVERTIAGIKLQHGEDEGRHLLQAESTDASIHMSITIDAFPQPSDYFIKELQKLMLVDISTQLAEWFTQAREG